MAKLKRAEMASRNVSATFRDFMKTPFSCCITFINARCKMQSWFPTEFWAQQVSERHACRHSRLSFLQEKMMKLKSRIKLAELRLYLSFKCTRFKLRNTVYKFKARAFKPQVQTKLCQFYYRLQFHLFFLSENSVMNGGTRAVEKPAGLRIQSGISLSSCTLQLWMWYNMKMAFSWNLQKQLRHSTLFEKT